MAIRGDTFGSVAEVAAVAAHLLDGQSTFNTITRPTGAQVETFLNRVSGSLNLALWKVGLNPSNIYANSTAKLACDDWVVAEAAVWVELTQRGSGYSEEEGSRTAGFRKVHDRAETFARNHTLAWKRMGITVSDPSSQGLTFTGLTAQADRTDPDDTSLEQPRFVKGKFDAT